MTTNQIVEHIEANNYSPFEALLYIHKVLTATDCLECIPTLASKYQSSLVNEIIDKLNYPNLSSNTISCCLHEKTKKSDIIEYYHNLVNLRDEDYFISGYYAIDTYADSNQNGFAHLLFPAKDLVHQNNYLYQGVIECALPIDYITLSAEPKTDRHHNQTTIPEYMSICSSNPPFAIPTFIRAMKKIFETAPELFEQQDFTEMLYAELSKTAATAQKVFDSNASSAFVVFAYNPFLNPTPNRIDSENQSE